MNVINVGFNSKYWNIFVEGSDEYKNLSVALDNGDAKTGSHIMRTVLNLIGGDYDSAYREAHNALKASEGIATEGDENVKCPFCQGDGVIEFEDIPTSGGYRDPTNAIDAEVSCNACGGEGSIKASNLLAEYAEDSYAEHVVMAAIRGEMVQAKSLAKAVMDEILSHVDDNFEKSTESFGK